MKFRISNIITALCLAAFLAAGAGFGQDQGNIVTAIRPSGVFSLYQYGVDGAGPTQISFGSPNMQLGYDFSADGRVAFEFFNNIYVMNSNGKGVRQLTFTNNNNQPAISRDGSLVAFHSNRNGNTDIYVVNWDGSNTRRVTTNQFIDRRPAFSPDGTKILFDTNRFSQFGLPNLMVINVDGTNETRLTFFFEFGGGYSPDGTKIVYQGRTEAGQNNFNEIFVMNATGGGGTQLTNNNVADESPCFSLDGSLIAFERSVPALGGTMRDHIFTMTPTGGSVQQITFPDAMNENREQPRWIPSNHLAVRARATDFDGEGRSDLAVFRPSEGKWYRKNIQEGTLSVVGWGLETDKLVAADYDRDAVVDHAVFRDGTWWIYKSTDQLPRIEQFGTAGDIPVPADFDADGIADLAIFRPSMGTWWVRRSSDGQIATIQFGLNGDVPLPGDFDGDSKRDIAVYRPSSSVWYVLRSSDGQVRTDRFGIAEDVPLNGDFNGDGLADLAVFRPSTGMWFVARSTGVPAQNFDATQFGISTDVPVPADYDGDEKTDLAVYRNGTWWTLRSSTGQVYVEQFGLGSDKPIAAAR